LALAVDVVDLADMFVGAPKIRAAAKAVPDRIVVNRFMISPMKEARLWSPSSEEMRAKLTNT
jgi:hypothetical protein